MGMKNDFTYSKYCHVDIFDTRNDIWKARYKCFLCRVQVLFVSGLRFFSVLAR